MKKLYYLFCLTLVVLASACTPEEENLFDKPSAKRVDAAIETTVEILTNASNGWGMQFFPSSSQKFGGYNLALAFDKKGVVKIASDVAGPAESASSLYSVKQSAGVILSLDTYNPIFHYFSDPTNPSGLGGRGKGLEGDYNFLVLEASAEKIVLKGKKTGSIAIMTPLDVDLANYISNILEAEENMAFDKINLVLGKEEIPVSFSNHIMTFTYNEDGKEKSQEIPYVVTNTGYKLYSPIEIKGEKLQEFTYDQKNVWFTETGNASVKLVPVILPLNQQFVSGKWHIAFSTAGEIAKPKFKECKESMESSIEKLEYAFFGTSQYGSFGFIIKTTFTMGYIGFNYELEGSDKVKLKFNWSGDHGLMYYFSSGFDSLLTPFGTNTERIFTLTSDNQYKPSTITLTEDANPKNVITLHRKVIQFPLDN